MLHTLSPLKHTLNVFFTKFTSTQVLSEEAFICYQQKLPKKINVSWERQADGFIVGKIQADGEEFFTQGKNAKDFIETVNDAIYAFYDIPPAYIRMLGGLEKYTPHGEELEKLKDKSIAEGSIGIVKAKQAAAG